MTFDSTTEVNRGRTSRPLRRVALAWLPAAAYMGIIWWLSSMSIDLPLSSLPWRDKLAHAAEYGVLGFLLSRAVRGTWPSVRPVRAIAAAAALTISWGYLDELHQAFVPGRDSSAWDLLADVIGAVVGASAYGVASVLWRAAGRRGQAS